jgi:hypothetical protein
VLSYLVKHESYEIVVCFVLAFSTLTVTYEIIQEPCQTRTLTIPKGADIVRQEKHNEAVSLREPGSKSGLFYIGTSSPSFIRKSDFAAGFHRANPGNIVLLLDTSVALLC